MRLALCSFVHYCAEYYIFVFVPSSILDRLLLLPNNYDEAED